MRASVKLTFALATLAFATCSAWTGSNYLQAAEPFKVMTYNIRYDSGGTTPSAAENAWIATEGTHRRDRVLKVIAKANPDLLGIQEGYANQVSDIASQLPHHQTYAIGRDDGKQAGEHCAVYWNQQRFELVTKGTYWLSEQPEAAGSVYPGAACPRIASWVRLRLVAEPRDELLVVNTHWDHISVPAREFAARSILEFVSAQADGAAVIVLGDMNANEQSPAIQQLLSSKQVPLVDAYRQVHPDRAENEATFNGFRNRTQGQRIDYVLHSPALTPRSAAIVRSDSEGPNASDHFPVEVELEWPTSPQP